MYLEKKFVHIKLRDKHCYFNYIIFNFKNYLILIEDFY